MREGSIIDGLYPPKGWQGPKHESLSEAHEWPLTPTVPLAQQSISLQSRFGLIMRSNKAWHLPTRRSIECMTAKYVYEALP